MLVPTQGFEQFLSYGGGELADQTQRGDHGEQQVVGEHDVKVPQPVEPPKVPQQVEPGDTWNTLQQVRPGDTWNTLQQVRPADTSDTPQITAHMFIYFPFPDPTKRLPKLLSYIFCLNGLPGKGVSRNVLHTVNLHHAFFFFF